MDKTRALYEVAMLFLKGIAEVNAKSLISYCGGAAAVFESPLKRLLQIPGIGRKTAGELNRDLALQQAEIELRLMAEHEIRHVFYTDPDYPIRLRHCHDAPIVLFYKGNPVWNAPRSIGIVGTRRASEYGKRFVSELLVDVPDKGLITISGLAYGVDERVHKESLKQKIPTIAVLGHGLQTVYPSVNRSLAKDITNESGTLVSGFTCQSNILPSNFLKRNRIIAGLSDAVIIVETGVKGGAISTAHAANGYNREVFALPGRYNHAVSSGCNFLIKHHKAAVIESHSDLMTSMNWDLPEVKAQIKMPLPIPLNEHEKKVLDVLRQEQTASIDYLQDELGLESGKLMTILLEMEMNGFVLAKPGKVFTAI